MSRLAKPPWLRLRPAAGAGRVDALVAEAGLRTVCREAACPNRGACYAQGTATFLLLGPNCTRRCTFCNVAKAAPRRPDATEPARVARAARAMGLAYVVLTSVTRDDLPDGGAGHFAACLAELGRALPGAGVEVLTPDFGGSGEALQTVLNAGPAVFNHNVETAPRLYAEVRPGADYDRSLGLLAAAAAAGLPAKSGLMLGLGETAGEVRDVLADLAGAGVRALTLGQYIAPSAAHRPVARWVEPAEFAAWADQARALGVGQVSAGPLVRSSHQARQMAQRLLAERAA